MNALRWAGRALMLGVATLGTVTARSQNTPPVPPVEPLDARRMAVLPDTAHSVPGKGFTVTGLARLADGTIWAGNDGRLREGDGSGYRPSLVRLNAGMTRVIAEIALPFTSSVQGVVVIGDRLWFALPSEQAVASTRLSGSPDIRIELRLPYRPNGLAWDRARDVLIVGSEIEKTLGTYRRRDGTLIETFKLDDAPDQLLMTRSGLIVTSGANRQAGAMLLLDDRARILRRWTLRGADAVEGIALRGDEMLVASDAYFHLALPGLNQILTYRRPDIIRR